MNFDDYNEKNIKDIFKFLFHFVITTWWLWAFSVYILAFKIIPYFRYINYILIASVILSCIYMLNGIKKDIETEKIINNANVEEIDEHTKKNLKILIESLFLPLSKVLLIVFFIFLIVAMCYADCCFTYFDFLYLVGEWFSVDSICSYFMNLYDNNPLVMSSIAISVIFAYLYMLAYMAQNRRYMFNKTEEGQKYPSFVLYFYDCFFNYFIVPFILLPFLCLKFLDLFNEFGLEAIKQFFEIVCIIFMYYMTISWFNPVANYYENVSYSYENIDRFNEVQKVNIFQTMLEVFNYALNNETSKNTRESHKLMDKFDKLLRKTILEAIKNIGELQKFIVSLTVIVSIIFWFLKFNLLTILYTILTLTIWYMVICHIQDVPTNKADITLTNNEKIKDVYIIEDNPEGYILVLDKDNKITKIMKGSIIKIEYKKP